MNSYNSFKKKLLKDPLIKQAYAELEPEFALATLLIKKRLARGMTQAQLAKKIGTQQSAIARLERGNYNPTLLFLRKTAKALGSEMYISFK